MNRRRLLASAVAVATSLILVPTACSNGSSTTRGSTLPDVELEPVGDAPALTLGAATTVPTVINLWATWCVPCRAELPAFNAVARKKEGAVRFVGVNIGEDAESATKFLEEIGSDYDHYVDSLADLQSSLSISSLPATVFVRRDGTVAEVHRGPLKQAELEKLLSTELGV